VKRKYGQDILNGLDQGDNSRYGFFKELDNLIVNRIRTTISQPTFVDHYRFNFSLFQLSSTNLDKFGIAIFSEYHIPLWEIHYFDDGFTFFTIDKEKDVRIINEDAKKQKHIYYTFKSLIPDLSSPIIINSDHISKAHKMFTLYNGVKTSKDFHKIDHKYGGVSQTSYGIDLYVINDDNATIDSFNKATEYLWKPDEAAQPIPDRVRKCFSDYQNNPINYKLKDLPQVMFLSFGTKYNGIAIDPSETIIVLDQHSVIGNDTEIAGSISLHEDAMIYPLEGVSKSISIGKNIVVGRKSTISSSHIGDGILIGNNVDTERGSRIGDGVFINDGVRLLREQEIPAGQTITATPSLYLSGMRFSNYYDYESFIRASERKAKPEEVED
jgi:NDP-sugar pyrophosphorylase family protein